jgi:hypothetical protein
MNKTAVELFAIALYEAGHLQGNGDEIQKLLEKHLEMEKEQMIDFAYDFSDELIRRGDLINAYNETYGGNK